MVKHSEILTAISLKLTVLQCFCTGSDEFVRINKCVTC